MMYKKCIDKYGGVFLGGIFRGGIHHGAIWRGGIFRGGVLTGGIFRGGVLLVPHIGVDEIADVIMSIKKINKN